MKNKTAAAKILLEAGWTWEEIETVLDMAEKPTAIIINNPPAYVMPVYVLPAPEPRRDWTYPPIVTCDSVAAVNIEGGNPTATRANSVPFTLT